jgi:MoaA/NifB/PqqE/SkfB family radical SAM enzyme
MAEPTTGEWRDDLSFMWMEITGKCQLECTHCYADSGPRGTHGAMELADWQRVIGEAAGLRVGKIQFIGGEPTLHPALGMLVQQALDADIRVEVFSNLVSIPPHLWSVFELPGVSLATSYYSPDAAEHDTVTNRKSHDRTLANMREVVGRGIPIRVGVIGVREGQQTGVAVTELKGLGIDDVTVDNVRQVGRGNPGREACVDELCGKCAKGVLAVSPSGAVWPCVFSRWLTIGNVLESSLGDLNQDAAPTRRELAVAFAGRTAARCAPDDGGCTPSPCKPIL